MHIRVKTVQRLERGCGYRKTHGLYLVGGGIAHVCDRLPLVIEPCPCCGERPRFSRGIQRIDFPRIYGDHTDGVLECECPKTCPVCWPSSWSHYCDNEQHHNTWLMWVGKDYTMESFIEEALKIGVSKKIAHIPKDLVVGRDWVFLARKNANPDEPISVTILGHRTQKQDLIFYAFRSQRIEYIITEEEANNTEFVETLIERGITPVIEKDVNHSDVSIM